jgi:tetratricopeptide (TPR) repeat protein
MATTETSFAVISLEEALLAKDEERARLRLRRDLDIGAFGASAVRQAKAGESAIGEHDELGPGSDGHEELYVVVAGGCTFTVEGEEVDAPQGTVVFVRNPAAKRSAVAKEDGTIVLAVGGRRGEAFRVTPGEEIAPFFALYQDKDYEGALAECRRMLEKWPGNALGLYNVACMESLLGRHQEALANLRDAIDGWPRFKENAIADEDFASLRDDPRFQALVA